MTENQAPVANLRETPGHSAGVFELCSGLLDLVVGVGRRGGGHRLTRLGYPDRRTVKARPGVAHDQRSDRFSCP